MLLTEFVRMSTTVLKIDFLLISKSLQPRYTPTETKDGERGSLSRHSVVFRIASRPTCTFDGEC